MNLDWAIVATWLVGGVAGWHFRVFIEGIRKRRRVQQEPKVIRAAMFRGGRSR